MHCPLPLHSAVLLSPWALSLLPSVSSALLMNLWASHQPPHYHCLLDLHPHLLEATWDLQFSRTDLLQHNSHGHIQTDMVTKRFEKPLAAGGNRNHLHGGQLLEALQNLRDHRVHGLMKQGFLPADSHPNQHKQDNLG